MTKTEILEKIDKGLHGQGNQVDIGNVLADVLTEIVDGGPTLTITSNTSGEDLTKEEFATNLGIAETEVDNLFRGDYKAVRSKKNNLFTIMPFILGIASDNGFNDLLFGSHDTVGGTIGAHLYVSRDESSGIYTIDFNEM